MRKNSYENLYETLINYLQNQGGSAEVDATKESLLKHCPNQESRVEELIWYLVQQGKLTLYGEEPVIKLATR